MVDFAKRLRPVMENVGRGGEMDPVFHGAPYHFTTQEEADYIFGEEPEPPFPELAPIPALNIPALNRDPMLLFLTGEAGTGKTTVVRHAVETFPYDYTVSATTGVAAMNADAITINSLLGFGTKEDLIALLKNGTLKNRLRRKLEGRRTLVLDEISMFHAGSLDALVEGIRQLNEEGREIYNVAKGKYEDTPLRLVVVGDFAQLPPVEKTKVATPWAFRANAWKDFEVQKLTTVHRQDNPEFVAAINAARRGNGRECVRLLQKCGVEFVPMLRDNLLTLFATNGEVHNWNQAKFIQTLRGQEGSEQTFVASRWGSQRQEWLREIDQITLCPNARVRITSNNTRTWDWVNGDQGVVLRLLPNAVEVKLDRTGETHAIGFTQRFNDVSEEQAADLKKSGTEVRVRKVYDDEGQATAVYYVGSVTHLPVKLGWGSTVHSVQGLSLSQVQVCPVDRFFGTANMAYVALSRARNPEGLVIHGLPGSLASKIKSAPEVQEWI